MILVALDQLCTFPQLFQKLGFCVSFRWKFWYHFSSVLRGTNVSEGLGVICAWDTTNEEAKFTKFSSIFCVKSTNVFACETAALETGVCCASWLIGSTEIPICAMWDWCKSWPNGCAEPAPSETTNTSPISTAEPGKFYDSMATRYFR